MPITRSLLLLVACAACWSCKNEGPGPTPAPAPPPTATPPSNQPPAVPTNPPSAAPVNPPPAVPANPPPAVPPNAPTPGAMTDPPPPAAPVTGGKALLVVGTIPLVGTDAQIRDALQARKIETEAVREIDATAAGAQGKRLVILSFSMQSTEFKARAEFAEVRVPIIVLEHFLLPVLGMTSNEGHGFQQNLTQLTMAAADPILSAGFPTGDLTVYARTQEMFWGTPGPGAIKVATAKGRPDRWVLFGYPAGAMMIDRPAPARRLQFFFAVHAPPPVTQTYLNDNGLRLLGAAIDWSLQ